MRFFAGAVRPGRVLVGTVLLPLVFGSLVLWSLADRAERTDLVPAAVVNLDKPVTQGSGDEEQIIAAGRLLAAGLTQPTDARSDAETGNLGWELTNERDANAGLRAGDYYVVITIPKGFSASLAALAEGDAKPAEILVQGNDASSALVAEAGRQVADVAAARLGKRVTRTVLGGIAATTGDLRLELGRASDAAGRVADGAGQVADGARRLDEGADELAGGLDALASGAATLGGGAGQLADGTTRLADGLGDLAGGAARLESGTARLADGLGRLDRGVADLPEQTDALADGARQVADGTVAYADLVEAWKDACADPLVLASRPQLCAATVQAAGVTGDNADRLRSGARQVASGARAFADAAPALRGGVRDAARGSDALADGAARVADGSAEAAEGARQLASGARRLDGGADELAGGAGLASDGAVRLADGSAQLDAGSARLGKGSATLASGLAEGVSAIPASDPGAARVLADPVRTVQSTLNPEREGSTLLTPVVLAFGLWLGAFVIYLVRRALPERLLGVAAAPWRLAARGWVPALVIGIVQGALLLASVLGFGASLQSPAGVVTLVLVAAAAFTALNQAFVATLGARRGWIAAIAFTALQAVSLGGLVPIDTAPAPLRVLHDVLPVSRAADGFQQLTLGGQAGSVWVDALVVALWGVAAFAVTTAAVRRRQAVTVADVRRQVGVRRRPLAVG